MDFRKVYESIFDTDVMPFGQWEFLYSNMPNGTIWEIGTYRGASAIAMALNEDRTVVSFDPHNEYTDFIRFGPKDYEKCITNIKIAETVSGIEIRSRIHLICEPFEKTAAHFSYQPDGIFVDGCHTREGVIANMKTIHSSNISDGVKIVLHDFRGAVEINCAPLGAKGSGGFGILEYNAERFSSVLE